MTIVEIAVRCLDAAEVLRSFAAAAGVLLDQPESLARVGAGRVAPIVARADSLADSDPVVVATATCYAGRQGYEAEREDSHWVHLEALDITSIAAERHSLVVIEIGKSASVKLAVRVS